MTDPLIVKCEVTHEVQGVRIEVHIGHDENSLLMAGVLWVDPADTIELVDRLEGGGYDNEPEPESGTTTPPLSLVSNDSDPEADKPEADTLPLRDSYASGGTPVSDGDNPWFSRPGRIYRWPLL
jgi:hypothetical protein